MNVDTAALYDARTELLDFAITAFADTPDPGFVADVLDGVRLPEESVTDRLDSGFAGIETFREANADRDPDALADALATEFTEVFVGPRPPVLAHESYYKEDVDYLGEGLAAVEESYSAAGWRPPEDYPEESDYVAVELAFLRHLVDRQRTGMDEAVGFERVFLEEHFCTWVEAFADDVHEHADSAFYPAAADVVAGIGEFEADLVNADG